jgi:hypothetical protein
MNNKIYLTFTILIGFSRVLFSQSSKDTCKTGIYLKSLYDFNSSAFSYDVDLWMWFHYNNDSINPLKSIEISNAKEYEYLNSTIEKKRNIIWASQNCKARINQNWDLKHYPFDRQKLEIILEESERDTNRLLLIADESEFEYNKEIDIKGWVVDSSTIKRGTTGYQSDFGDPSLNGRSGYSKIYYTIYLSRESVSLFFKLFTGVYVAFLVSFLSLFIKPTYVDPRFGLSIGGLFAAVGNKYVVDANIPESISFTLVDKIHDITFLFILLSLLVSVISLKLYDNKSPEFSKRFDKVMSYSLFAVFTIVNIVMIYGANQ